MGWPKFEFFRKLMGIDPPTPTASPTGGGGFKLQDLQDSSNVLFSAEVPFGGAGTPEDDHNPTDNITTTKTHHDGHRSQAKDRETCGILDLPRELRNAIHELILKLEDHTITFEQTVDSETERFIGPQVKITDKPNVDWMLACKQIHVEYLDTIKRCSVAHITTHGTWNLAQLASDSKMTISDLDLPRPWVLTSCEYANIGSSRRMTGQCASPAGAGTSSARTRASTRSAITTAGASCANSATAIGCYEEYAAAVDALFGRGDALTRG